MDSKPETMVIANRESWNSILSSGAVILWDEKLFKVFRMPDGKVWRVLSRWRRAWRFMV